MLFSQDNPFHLTSMYPSPTIDYIIPNTAIIKNVHSNEKDYYEVWTSKNGNWTIELSIGRRGRVIYNPNGRKTRFYFQRNEQIYFYKDVYVPNYVIEKCKLFVKELVELF